MAGSGGSCHWAAKPERLPTVFNCWSDQPTQGRSMAGPNGGTATDAKNVSKPVCCIKWLKPVNCVATPVSPSMSFPLRIPDQLKQHLRALRKSRGLTQGQLGALVGVRQARIAEIEANPGAVSLDQLTKVLAALGGTLHLHSAEGAGTESRVVPDEVPQSAPMSVAKRAPKPSTKAVGQVVGAPMGRRSRPTRTTKPASVTSFVIRPKKGTW